MIKPIVRQPDFQIQGGGSLYLFCPLTSAAREWLETHCPADGEHQYLGPNLAVEHRYISSIINYAINDGLNPS